MHVLTNESQDLYFFNTGMGIELIKIPITVFLQEILKNTHFPKNPVELWGFFNEKPKMKNCWLSEIFAVKCFAKRQKRYLKTFF